MCQSKGGTEPPRKLLTVQQKKYYLVTKVLHSFYRILRADTTSFDKYRIFNNLPLSSGNCRKKVPPDAASGGSVFYRFRLSYPTNNPQRRGLAPLTERIIPQNPAQQAAVKRRVRNAQNCRAEIVDIHNRNGTAQCFRKRLCRFIRIFRSEHDAVIIGRDRAGARSVNTCGTRPCNPIKPTVPSNQLAEGGNSSRREYPGRAAFAQRHFRGFGDSQSDAAGRYMHKPS